MSKFEIYIPPVFIVCIFDCNKLYSSCFISVEMLKYKTNLNCTDCKIYLNYGN